MGVNCDGILKGYSLDVLFNIGVYVFYGYFIVFVGGNKVVYFYFCCVYVYSLKICYINFFLVGVMCGYGVL